MALSLLPPLISEDIDPKLLSIFSGIFKPYPFSTKSCALLLPSLLNFKSCLEALSVKSGLNCFKLSLASFKNPKSFK